MRNQALLQHTEPTSNACDVLSFVSPTANREGTEPFDSGTRSPLARYQFESGQRHSTGSMWFSSLGNVTTDVISPDEYVWIDNLREEGYRVVRAFCVQITRIGVGNFEASFREANIAISGTDRDDAYQALVAEILDTFDILAEERNLIPRAVEQLEILRKYIVQVQDNA